MVRQIQVTVPLNRGDEVEELLHGLQDVHNLGRYDGTSTAMFIFRAREKKTGSIVFRLECLGVGVHFGVIDILNLQMTKPRLRSHARPANATSKRAYRVDDRMTVEEIHEAIDAQVHLTFDYLALTSSAAVIAGAGLLTNSSVLVVASMLVSPLMGPILGLCFGTSVRDCQLITKGFRNEVVGILLTFAFGAVCALVVVPFGDLETDWVTYQMTQRAVPSALTGGVAVAIASGVGLAISVTSEQIAGFVGVAISASLLPPIANSGIFFVFGLVSLVRKDDDLAAKHLRYAAISMLLFLLNWTFIYLFAVLFFYIKRIRYKSRKVHGTPVGKQIVDSPSADSAFDSPAGSGNVDIKQPLVLDPGDSGNGGAGYGSTYSSQSARSASNGHARALLEEHILAEPT